MKYMRMETDDSKLAFDAAGGDAAAFRMLLERHYDLVFRVAFRFLGNRADAEDVAQDICISLSRKIKSYRGDARFKTWLYRVVVNAARDYIRTNAAARKAHETYADIRALREAGHDDRQTQLGWMYEMLESLDETLRETVLLILAEGLSHAEAGEILGVKESTISWRMHEARNRLKSIGRSQL